MTKLKLSYYFLRKWVLILVAVVFSPVFFALIAKRRRKPSDPERPRILIIPQFTRIGDLVCVTPVFRAIKERYPKSHIAVLVTGRTMGIIKNNPRVDQIIQFKSIDFLSRVLPEVRRGNFDWSFNFSATAVGTIISLLGLIQHRTKITRHPRPLSEILTDWLAIPTRYEHHTYLPRYYLKMLEHIGIKNAAEVKEVFTIPEGDRKAEKFFRDKGIVASDMVVGISIAANNKIKEWGDANFKEVAKYVNQKYRAKVVFLGTPKDEPRIEAVLSQLGNPDFFKVTNFTLEELPSFMKRLNLYIAVDTGPIYIAHALKIPLIDIIGPVDPREQPPKDERSIQVLPAGNIEPSSFVLKKAKLSTKEMSPYEKVTIAINQLLKIL